MPRGILAASVTLSAHTSPTTCPHGPGMRLRIGIFDKTLQALYDYWILGKNAVPQPPRWSIIRNVLHWVE
jgi:hypothetical protein